VFGILFGHDCVWRIRRFFADLDLRGSSEDFATLMMVFTDFMVWIFLCFGFIFPRRVYCYLSDKVCAMSFPDLMAKYSLGKNLGTWRYFVVKGSLTFL
jgi:hypothetical protein